MTQAKEKMEHVQRALDDYECRLGLPLVKENESSDELTSYLHMSRNEIEQLDPSGCGQISVRLLQYAFYLQRQQNKEKSRVKWADAEIEKYVCDKMNNVSNQIMKHNLKVNILAKQDAYLYNLIQIQTYAQQRVDRLDYLSTTLKNLADTFLAVQREKIKRKE